MDARSKPNRRLVPSHLTEANASFTTSSRMTRRGVMATSRRKQDVGGDNRWAACVDGVDDFGVVDALQVDRRDPQVGVSELALNDDERVALAGHLDRVRVAKLMWREASADAGQRGGVTELFSRGRR